MKTTDKREAGKYVRDSTHAEMLQNVQKRFSSSLCQLLLSMLIRQHHKYISGRWAKNIEEADSNSDMGR